MMLSTFCEVYEDLNTFLPDHMEIYLKSLQVDVKIIRDICKILNFFDQAT